MNLSRIFGRMGAAYPTSQRANTLRRRNRTRRLWLETLESRQLLATILIGNSSANEGQDEVFQVTLSESSSEEVSVSYFTSNGTAQSNADYSPASGVLVFSPGQTSRNLVVHTLNNSTTTSDTEFTMQLSNPQNAELDMMQFYGTGTIVDTTPRVSVSGGSADEASPVTFTVHLSAAAAQPVVVTYATIGMAAAANQDFTSLASAVTIPAGSTSVQVAVNTLRDLEIESDEDFMLTLTTASSAAIDQSQNMANGLIHDVPPPVIFVSDASTTEGQDLVFLVTLSHASDESIRVTYATEDFGNWTNTTYVPASGVVAFVPGETAHQVRVTTINDTGKQNGITVNFNLSNPVNALLDVTMVPGTIADGPPVLLGIGPASAREGQPLTFTATLSRALASPITVGLSYMSGTAFEGDDFNPSTTSVTFAAGETSRPVTVPTTADPGVEGDEDFVVALNFSDPALNVELNPAAAMGTGMILENHAPSVALPFTPLNLPVDAEPESVILVDVFADADADVLTYAVVNNSNPGLLDATIAGQRLDVELLTGQSGTAQLTVRATDPVGNSVETTLAIIVNAANLPPATSGVAAVSVAEGDAPTTINLTNSFSDPNEPATNLAYHASSDNPAVVQVAVDSGQLVLSYVPESNGQATVSVIALNSLGLSVSTTFQVTVNPVNDGPVAVTVPQLDLNQGSDTVRWPLASLFTDLDDNPWALGFEIVTNSNPTLLVATVDAENRRLVLSPSAGQTGTVAVAVRATDSGGLTTTSVLNVRVDGRPQVSTPSGFGITASAMDVSATLNVAGNFQDDTTGGLTYSIESFSSTFISAARVDPVTGLLTVWFTANNEGSGSVAVLARDQRGNSALLAVPVTRGSGGGGGSSDPLPVVWVTADDWDAAEAGGAGGVNTGQFLIHCSGDCANRRVNFTTGGSSSSSINGVPNTGTSTNTSGSVQFSGPGTQPLPVIPGSPPGSAAGVPTSTTATITDSTQYTNPGTSAQPSSSTIIVITRPTYTVTITGRIDGVEPYGSAAGTPARFVVTRTPQTGPLVVNYQLMVCTVAQVAGQACANDLAAPLTGQVSFANNVSSQSFEVNIATDSLEEIQEKLTARITTGTDYLDGAEAFVWIKDTVPVVSVRWVKDAVEGGGNGQWEFKRTLGGPSLTVNYEIDNCPSASTACPNDYTAPPRVGSATFSQNATTVTLDLTAPNDGIVEGPETAVLRVKDGSGYSVGAPANATVTITDASVCASPSIKVDNAQAKESDGVQFRVYLTSPCTTKTISVKYYTEDGSATSAADYTGIPQAQAKTITFTPGATEAFVTISTIADTICEDDETFSLKLKNAVNAAIGQNTATGKILDYEDFPSVSVNNVTVDEGQTATFTLTLSKSCARSLTVNYHTADGSALGTPPAFASNADYYAITSGSATFSAGQTTRTATVGTIDDTRAEGNETFQFLASPPEGATGSDASGTGTIVDNDQPKPTITINDVIVPEGNTAVFTVSISGAPAQPVTLSFITQDGSAVAASPENDYNANSGTITFSGAGSQTISVATNADTRPEWSENFYVILALVGSGGAYATIVDDRGVGTIIDDDDGGPADAHLILHKAHCNCSCTTCDSDGQVTEVKDGGFIHTAMAALAALPAYMADATFNTNPIFNVVLKLPPGTATPNRVDATPTVGSVVGSTKSFSVSGFQAGSDISFAVQLDVSTLATGVYPLNIDIKATFVDGKTASAAISQPWIVINLLNSPFGGRRWLSLLDRLVVPSPGSPLSGVGYVVGNNTAWWFQSSGTSYVTPDGLFSTMTKLPDGFYELKDKYGDIERFSPDGLLVTKIDRNGNQTQFQYIDANGDAKQDELERIVDPSGRVTRYIYANNKLQKVTDYAGRETGFQYTGALTFVTHPLTTAPDGETSQSVEAFGHDAQGRLTSHIDAMQRQTYYLYDANDGRYRRSDKADGSVWTVEIAQRKGLPGSNQGDPLHPAAAISPSQVVATATDARYNSSTLQVDDYGNLLKKVDPLNNTYIVERDQHGHPVRSIVPDPDKLASGDGPLPDLVTRYEYDTNGNLVKLTLPDGSTQSWVHEPNFSQVTESTNELGQVTKYQVDSTNGNVTKVTQVVRSVAAGPGQAGNSTYPWQNPRHKFDVNNDGVVSLVDANAILVSTLASLPNPPTAGIHPPDYVDTNADGQIAPIDALVIVNYLNALPDVVTNLTYTANTSGVPNGLPLTGTDPLGRVTRYTYATAGASRGWLQSLTEAEGTSEQGVVQFQYDLAGNVTAVIDELGRQTDFIYDARDRQIRLLEVDPDGGGPLARPVSELRACAKITFTS